MTTTHAPVDADRLAGDLLTLEIGFTASFHDDAAVAERIEQAAAALDRTGLVLRARLARAVVMLREGETVEGGRLVHRVYPEAVELGDDYLLARCHLALSIFFRQLGDNATALAHAVQCMSHTADDVPPAIRSRHLMCLAVLLDETGSPQEALRVFTEALGLAAAHHDDDLALHLLNNMAYTAYERGDLPAAEELVRRMRATPATAGIPLNATCLDTMARVALPAGRYDEVARILDPLLADEAPRHLLDEGNALEEALLTAAAAFRELAHRDALTGLHNRRHADDQLPVVLAAGAAAGTRCRSR